MIVTKRITPSVSEDVSDGISHSDMRNQSCSLRLRQSQPVDRVRCGSHGGTLRERTRLHEASREPGIQLQRLCNNDRSSKASGGNDDGHATWASAHRG